MNCVFLRLLVPVCSIVLMASASSAAVRRGPEMTLEQLTKKADSVVIGKVDQEDRRRCVGSVLRPIMRSRWRRTLKGKLRQPGNRFVMTVLGGSVSYPPITQFAELQPQMMKDEDVALFLRETPVKMPDDMKKAISPDSKLPTTPRCIGMNEGKFTVFTDQKDGRRKIARMSMEYYGYVHDDDQMQKIIRAVATHEVNVTSGPVVKLGGGLVTTPEGKAMIDAAAEAKGLTVASPPSC